MRPDSEALHSALARQVLANLRRRVSHRGVRPREPLTSQGIYINKSLVDVRRRAHAGERPEFAVMRLVDPCAALGVKGSAMQIQSQSDVHFEALKDLTRLTWLLNFEAVATVPAKADSVSSTR